MRRTPCSWALVLTFALFTVACTAQFDGATQPSSGLTGRSGASTTDGTSASPAEAALAAYNGMWNAMADAAQTSDHQSPALERYASGEALAKIIQSLYLDRQRGLVTKGRPVLHPTVASVTAAEVRIEDCGDSTDWLKYTMSGQPQNDRPGGRQKISANVTLAGGEWRVTDFVVMGVGSC